MYQSLVWNLRTYFMHFRLNFGFNILVQDLTDDWLDKYEWFAEELKILKLKLNLKCMKYTVSTHIERHSWLERHHENIQTRHHHLICHPKVHFLSKKLISTYKIWKNSNIMPSWNAQIFIERRRSICACSVFDITKAKHISCILDSTLSSWYKI